MKIIQNIEKANLIMTLRSMGISSSEILSAIENVPRDLFVPKNLLHYAYENSPLPIGFNQTISQPYIVALMTEKLNLKSNDIVLEIGTGSGYQTSILSKLVRRVYSIERVNPLLVRAKNLFKELKLTNIITKLDDGYFGWENMSPFDNIIITCSMNNISENLLSQIRIGGKCVVPFENSSGKQILKCITISESKDHHFWEDLCEVNFVPLVRD